MGLLNSNITTSYNATVVKPHTKYDINMGNSNMGYKGNNIKKQQKQVSLAEKLSNQLQKSYKKV